MTFGIDMLLVKRRGRMVGTLVLGVVVVVPAILALVVVVAVVVAPVLLGTVAVGVAGRRSLLPRRARSCFVDCRSRLCILGRCIVMSCCTGAICRALQADPFALHHHRNKRHHTTSCCPVC